MNDGSEQTEEENKDITLFNDNQTVTSTQGLLESEKKVARVVSKIRLNGQNDFFSYDPSLPVL